MPGSKATLRTCAECEWIFKAIPSTICPQCGGGSYGARYTYGREAYKYASTQEPWTGRKRADLELEMRKAREEGPTHSPAPRPEQVMPKVDGKPFRCVCGGNVFSKEADRYKCNSCGRTYKEE